MLLPKDYVRLRLTGEHATDVADASGTLLFDVAARRWSEECSTRSTCRAAWLPPALESPQVSGTDSDGIVPSPPAPATRPPARSASASTGRARSRSCSALPGVVFAALPEFAADPEARLHAFCHAVPGGWHAMGVMLSAAGSLRWLRRRRAATTYDELIAEAERWPPGRRGALVRRPTWRASGRRTPTRRARRVRRALAAPRPRRARPRRARGRRLRPPRLARAPARARRRRRTRARLGRRRPERALAPDRRLGARPAARADPREEGAAYGAALLGGVAAGVYSDVHEAVEACHPRHDYRRARCRWRAAYDDGYARFRALYPALRPLEDA